MGEEKSDLALCEVGQFLFPGPWVHVLQFQFLQVSLLGREILTFRLKEAKWS